MDPGRVQFGLFDWLDDHPGLGSLAELYDQRLRVLEEADRAGLFWAYHLAEHHQTPLGMAPSPGLFLAAAARCTRRLRLGPMVYLLPLYEPVRLVQEICMLDHLSHGRLELGVGRGASKYEMAMFNVAAEETKRMFDEAFAIILQGLETGRMNFEGSFFTVKDAALTVRPYQRPYPPLWYPTNNAATIPWLAGNGFSFLATSNVDRTSTIAEGMGEYKRRWAEGLGKPGRLNGHVSQPKCGPIRHVYVADDEAEAERVARAAWAVYAHSYAYLWKLNGDPRHDDRGDFDRFRQEDWILAGSVDTVRAGIERTIAETGCNYIATCFTWGNLSLEQTLRSLHLFTNEVAPGLSSGARRDIQPSPVPQS